MTSIEALSEIVQAMTPAQLAHATAGLSGENLAVLERIVGEVTRAGWRSSPSAMAHQLSGGRVKRYAYTELLSRKFVDAVEGRSKRQIWNVPPRYGKSFLASKWGPVWALDRDPTTNIILASYGDELANENAVFIRDALVEHSDLLSCHLRHDRRRMDRFVTDQGGGIIAAGVGSALTGFGGKGAIVDDPFKNWQEAHSEARRQLVWDWFRAVLRTRLEGDDAWIIVVQTRWHQEDLTGKLLEAQANDDGEAWELVRLPALADDPDDLLGRALGEPLEPTMFSLASVQATMTSLGSYLGSGLMQQTPSPEAGTDIMREWWKWYDTLPPRFDDELACLPANSLVFSEDGPRPISDIRVGDRVWSLDQTTKRLRLARVWRNGQTGIDHILRIETNGRTIRANGKHRLLVRRKFAAPRAGAGGYKAVEWRTVWLPAAEVTINDYLIAAHGMPDGVEDEAPNGRVLTPAYMAFMGLYIGDGSIAGGTIQIARHPEAPYNKTYKRFAHAEFRRVVGSRKGIPRGVPVEPSAPVVCVDRGYCLSFSSRSAVRELRELGFGGVARTKRVPEWVFGLRPDLVLAFLRGYLDADGAVNSRGHITYSSVNPMLLEDVRHLCMLVGVPISEVRRYHMAGRVYVAGRWVNRGDICQIFGFDPRANQRIGSHHPTKRDRLSATRVSTDRSRWHPDYEGAGSEGSRPGLGFALDGGALVRVKRIEIEAAEPVFDLGVEGTHSFIANGVIVHNSWDMKLKEKDSGDFVVGQWWGRTGSDFWLGDQLRGRFNFAATKAAIVLMNVRHPSCRRHIIENTGNGPEVMEALRRAQPDYRLSEETRGALGISDGEVARVEQIMHRGLTGLLAENPRGDKRARMRAQAPLIESGHVHVPLAAGIGELVVNEASEFPNGAHDDMVDALSQALKRLGKGPGKAWKPPGQVRSPRPGVRVVPKPSGRGPRNGGSRLR